MSVEASFVGAFFIFIFPTKNSIASQKLNNYLKVAVPVA